MKCLKTTLAVLITIGFAICSSAEIKDDVSFTPQDVALYRVNAMKGDPEAMYLFSMALCYGWGIDKNQSAATEFARQSAMKGCKYPLYFVSRAYRSGSGVQKSKEKADKFSAQYFVWAKKMAENGNSHVQALLGHCYLDGLGVKADFKEGFKWYMKSAQKGNVDGMYRVALCYMEGTGVAKDLKSAFEWFKKAAEKGFAPAQSALGECYEKGMGIVKSKDEAMKWYVKSALQHHGKALESIKRLCDNPEDI